LPQCALSRLDAAQVRVRTANLDRHPNYALAAYMVSDT
jgi:hypothetical protein